MKTFSLKLDNFFKIKILLSLFGYDLSIYQLIIKIEKKIQYYNIEKEEY